MLKAGWHLVKQDGSIVVLHDVGSAGEPGP
jgi:hypothetical protein